MTPLGFFHWIFAVIVLATLPDAACSQTEIGQSASFLKKIEVDSSGNILIKRGINKKLYQCTYQGISYWITLDSKRTIDFVMTNDLHFSPPEGLKVGSTYEQVLKFNDYSAHLEKDWASFVKLESGWYAAFEPLNVSSNLNLKIKFFFKRYDLR